MKKIPTIFERDWNGDRRFVTRTPHDVCAWVFAGEGTPTIKWDGTSCLIRDGKMFKRYELRPGKSAPPGFEPAGDADPETGKVAGWVPVGAGPEDKWHREALAWRPHSDGTYELVGPKVQGNPHGQNAHHILLPHGKHPIPDAPRDFDGLREYLAREPREGLVWHHPDGRMAKIKARDFGLSWPRTATH